MKELDSIRKLKMIMFEVDGVFTDGRTWQGADGSWHRCFSVRDKMGIRALLKAGYRVVVITSVSSPEIREQMASIGIESVFENVDDKLTIVDELLASTGIRRDEVGLMTEDVRDLPLAHGLGFCFTVFSAPQELKSVSCFVSEQSGGDGAVSELCSWILQQGQNTQTSRSRVRRLAAG